MDKPSKVISKPKVLILGGSGFVGRNLVHYLITNDLVERIRVVDRRPPHLAYPSRKHAAAFKSEKVEFFSANLINPTFCENAFKTDDASGWDYVVNCAAETRVDHDENPVYQDGIVQLSLNCAREAVKCGAKRFVELSTAAMCSSESVPQKEDCPMEPWSKVGEFKAKAEKKLAKVDGLKYTILRLAICYGISDFTGLTPRITVAAVYKYLKEKMTLLWTESLKMNVVHVEDVCGAVWELMQKEETLGETINICDDSDATQGLISDLLADIFGITIDYYGMISSQLAVPDVYETMASANDKHLKPWTLMCQAENIHVSPIWPYMEEDQVAYNNLNLDNSKMKSYGYKLKHPKITRKHLEEIIEDFIESKYFPPSYYSGAKDSKVDPTTCEAGPSTT